MYILEYYYDSRTHATVLSLCLSATRNREKSEIKIQLEYTTMTPLVSDHFQEEVLFGIPV
jgi:hypothetical protein